MHGDLILADRGFNITEPLAICGASLAIPPFTKGKCQLHKRTLKQQEPYQKFKSV